MLKEVIVVKGNVVDKILFTDMEPFGDIEGSCINEEGDDIITVRDAVRMLPSDIEFRNENIAYIDLEFICSKGWSLNADTLDLIADECAINEKYTDYLVDLIKAPEDEKERERKSKYVDLLYHTIIDIYELSIKFLQELSVIMDEASVNYLNNEEETTEITDAEENKDKSI